MRLVLLALAASRLAVAFKPLAGLRGRSRMYAESRMPDVLQAPLPLPRNFAATSRVTPQPVMFVGRPSSNAADARAKRATCTNKRVQQILCDAKLVQYGDESRRSLIRGLDKVANAVKVTLGPRGRNVVLQPGKEEYVVINDGVSIASYIDLPDMDEQVGAKLVVQACSQTDSRAGDGTTTSAVLTQALVGKGRQLVSNGANSVALQRGLNKAARFFVQKIREAAMPVTTLEQYAAIAGISANSESMGQLVAEAVMRVGFDGAVTTEEGREMTDSLEFSEGLEQEAGYVSDKFITDVELQSAVLTRPRVLVTDQKITNMQELLPTLEALVQNKEPLVIFALDVSGEALSGLVLNHQKGVISVCPVRAPGIGEVRDQYLEDIAIFAGAKYITEQLGRKVKDVKPEDLGRVERAVITKQKTVLVSTGDHEDAVEKRVKVLKGQIDARLGTEKSYEIDRLEQRIQKLRGAVARIIIGAPTEAEMEDKRLRYEDSINALKGGIAEGMVPGGGACFAYMLRYADEARALFDQTPNGQDEALAVDVIVEAMSEPIRQIATNAGLLGEFVLKSVENQPWGYGLNARTLEYEDLLAAGVTDPATVTTWALENSASIAGSLLTTEALVCRKERPPEEEEYVPEFQMDTDQEAAANLAW